MLNFLFPISYIKIFSRRGIHDISIWMLKRYLAKSATRDSSIATQYPDILLYNLLSLAWIYLMYFMKLSVKLSSRKTIRFPALTSTTVWVYSLSRLINKNSSADNNSFKVQWCRNVDITGRINHILAYLVIQKTFSFSFNFVYKWIWDNSYNWRINFMERLKNKFDQT